MLELALMGLAWGVLGLSLGNRLFGNLCQDKVMRWSWRWALLIAVQVLVALLLLWWRWGSIV